MLSRFNSFSRSPTGPDPRSEADTIIDHDLLRKWVALASWSNLQISGETVLEHANNTFFRLCRTNGYDENDRFR
jgi:hypothetical protein